ncbi:MFS transporter [Goodfellowiella coeruleoviolacea]|uniref:Sugar phosphate permease n=1 Tax=Goodfellowiella coeruleoviolacea TaxID=334858 RepID=A0AAE3KK27_9PSEU|nr:MFS transporter [Goodfellowiella coeruleoviolacea]MCP2169732.1 Sugar phosphate permease [Goodfellowiella coeruleoviolacea]
MTIEDRVVRKLTVRLLPILIFGYFIAILDRANVGVAALTMNADIGLSAAAFGLAAGIFFVPYVILEVPSNLALARFGARFWIARIMFTWGVISGLHAIIWNAESLYVLRALLGAAEAGFFPGVILYLTTWFPAAYRGRIIAMFTTGIPIALVIGTPISGLILTMDDWLGLHGWQWVYLIEALPAVVLAVAIPFLLPSKPEGATFLTEQERDWLVGTLAAERAARDAQAGAGGHSVLKALLSPRVLLFCVAYYGLTNLNGAVSTFLPQILQPFGLGNTATTFVAAVPYAVGVVGMIVLGRIADRPGRRWFATYLALAVAVVGLVGAGAVDVPVVKLIALCVAAFGVFGVLPIFWGLPTALLSSAAAAGGIALINSLGNISSVVNPAVIGAIRESTGDFNGGLFWLAGMAVVAVVALAVIYRLWGGRTPTPSATSTSTAGGH